MDRARRKQRQTIRLIITEIIMVVAVIVTVIVLTMLAMGYNLNKEGEVGQQGIAQINSRPTGAVINIDGDDILPRTNAARMLSAGEHRIKIAKDNYDSWEKTVTIESGVVLKLDYPRLFWQGRTVEKMRELEGELVFFEPAPNHDSILYATKDGGMETAETGKTEAERAGLVWNWLDIRGDTAVDEKIDVSELMRGLEIEKVIWNGDGNKVLVRAHDVNGQLRWVLVNLKNLQNSAELSAEFGLQFSEMSFMTGGGERLLALESDGNLRALSMTDKTASQVLANGVREYVVNGNTLMYATKNGQVKILREGDEDVLVAEFPAELVVKIGLFEYLSKKYLALVAGEQLYVYRGDYPNAERSLSDMEKVYEGELGLSPEQMRIEADSELVVLKQGRKVAVFDAELSKLHQFELGGEQLFFIDFYLMGTISDSKLIIYDFDGQNRRELTAATGTALITKNGKWLYYLNGNEIDREQIVD